MCEQYRKHQANGGLRFYTLDGKGSKCTGF